MMTERERAIARQAYQTGYGRGHNDTVEGRYNSVCEHENDCADEWIEEWQDAFKQAASQQEPAAWIFDSNYECLLPYEVEKETLVNNPGLYTPLYLHPAPIPLGWKLVPEEPTESMQLAYTKCKTEAGFRWARHQWKAMLAAAPEYKEPK